MIFLQQFGAENVAGHQVGGELDAMEVELERFAQRTDEKSLAKARHTFKQAMPPGKQADQQLFDHIGLPDDRLPDRGAQFGEAGETSLNFGFGDFSHDSPLLGRSGQ